VSIIGDERFKVDVEGEWHGELFLSIGELEDIFRIFLDNQFDFHPFFRDIVWHGELFLGIDELEDIFRIFLDNRFDFHPFFFHDIVDSRDIVSLLDSVGGEGDGAWLVRTAIGEVAVEQILAPEAMQAIGAHINFVSAGSSGSK
jgi:hypothetical protein